jgi:hypothetical protein
MGWRNNMAVGGLPHVPPTTLLPLLPMGVWKHRLFTSGGRYGCKGGAVVELEAVRTVVVPGDTSVLVHTSDLAGHRGITEAVCGVGAWRSVSNKVDWEASLVVFSSQLSAPLSVLLDLASDMFCTSPLCQWGLLVTCMFRHANDRSLRHRYTSTRNRCAKIWMSSQICVWLS